MSFLSITLSTCQLNLWCTLKVLFGIYTYNMKSFTAKNISSSSFFHDFIQLHYGELHIKQDDKTVLLAIIAIHSTHLGPAIGGCRFRPYATIDEAIIDAHRLAHGMSYKA